MRGLRIRTCKHAGLAFAQAELGLQVFGQVDHKSRNNRQLHARAQTGDHVDWVAQESLYGQHEFCARNKRGQRKLCFIHRA